LINLKISGATLGIGGAIAPITPPGYAPGVMCKGAPTLDGARGKKEVWRPHVRTYKVFREPIHCIEESVCDIIGDF